MPFGVDQVLVSRSGEIADASAEHFVDRNCDRAVLEERLFEVEDVVDDHFGPGRGQGFDVFGKRGFAVEGRGESQARARSEVVDDLRHRPALICRSFPAAGFVAFEDVDEGCVAAGIAQAGKIGVGDVFRCSCSNRTAAVDRFGRLVERVGEDADGDAAAVD